MKQVDNKNRCNQAKSEELEKLTFEEHISELKIRVIKCVVFFLMACGVAMFFSDEIYNFLARPLINIIVEQSQAHTDRKLIFTGLTEGFMTHMRLGIYTALMLSFPCIAWQVYAFLAPGLYKKERKLILPMVLFSAILFFCGIVMAYYLVIPLACRFFISFEGVITVNNNNIPIVLEAKISEYLSTIMQLFLSFGIVLQLPVALAIMAKFGFVNAQSLRKYRRHAIVVNFVIAAILTPPDVISQILLAVPMMILYELSILLCSRITKMS